MNFKNTISLISLIAIFCIACQSKTKQPRFDMMKYGVPLVINAPTDSEVKVEDLGVMKDITVKAGDDYSIQIIESGTTTSDISKTIANLKADVSKDKFFAEIVQEDDHGFLYKKDIDGTEDYDFRYVRINGDKEYLFQTSLYGTFELDQVKTMYESVKK